MRLDLQLSAQQSSKKNLITHKEKTHKRSLKYEINSMLMLIEVVNTKIKLLKKIIMCCLVEILTLLYTYKTIFKKHQFFYSECAAIWTWS